MIGPVDVARGIALFARACRAAGIPDRAELAAIQERADAGDQDAIDALRDVDLRTTLLEAQVAIAEAVAARLGRPLDLEGIIQRAPRSVAAIADRVKRLGGGHV